jgi:hypothetical protein
LHNALLHLIEVANFSKNEAEEYRSKNLLTQA